MIGHGTERTERWARRAALACGAAILALSPVGGAAPAWGEGATPMSGTEAVGTYTKADQATMGKLKLMRTASGVSGNQFLIAAVPKGAELARIRVFGDAAVAGFQLGYKVGGAGAVVETEVVGAATGKASTLDFAAGERVVVISTNSGADGLHAITFQTSQGRFLTGGQATGDTTQDATIPGKLVALSVTGAGPFGQFGAVILGDTPGALAQMSFLDGTGGMKSSALGWTDADKLTRDGQGAGGEAFELLAPKGYEIAAIMVYGEQLPTGVQLAYRKPGSGDLIYSKVGGVRSAKMRTLTLAPGETVEEMGFFHTDAGVHKLFVTKNTKAQVNYGSEADFSKRPGFSGRGFSSPNPSTESFGLVGLRGSADAKGLTGFGVVRYPQEVASSAFVGLPGQTSVGCATSQAAVAESTASAKDRLLAKRAPPAAVTNQRVFAGLETDEVQAGKARSLGIDLNQECRYALDGVWATANLIVLASVKTLPDNMAATGPSGQKSAIDSTNGNYVTKSFLMVSAPDPDNQIMVRDGLGDGKHTAMNSSDGVVLRDVLSGASAATKTYAGGGRTLRVSVERLTLKTKLELDGKAYFRPRPTVMGPQATPITDTFTISASLDNLTAARRGYDLVKEDPFAINQNKSGIKPVFAEPDERYYYYFEKQAIPIGLIYKADGGYGMSSTESMITSETEFQKSVTNAFGASVGFSAGGGEDKPKNGGSVAVDFVKSHTAGKRNGSTTSYAMSMVRNKKYAVVVDHPFVRLDPDFYQAIDDAYYKTGNWQAVIDDYGTHYAYAVTYGTAANSIEEFNSESFASWTADSSDLSIKATGAYKGVEGSVNYSHKEDSSQTAKSDVGTRISELQAQCSQDKGGMQGEKDCPILLDLRPLDELINPMNYPGQEDFVYQARPRLHNAIAVYLASNAGQLSSEAGLPQVWQVQMTGLRCSKIGSVYAENAPAKEGLDALKLENQHQTLKGWIKSAGVGINNTATLKGVITFSVSLGSYGEKGFRTKYTTGFNHKDDNLDIPCDDKAVDLPGAVTFSGTAAEMQRAKLGVSVDSLIVMNGDRTGFFYPDEVIKADNGSPWILPNTDIPAVTTTKVGETVTSSRQVSDGAKGLPTLWADFSFKRVR